MEFERRIIAGSEADQQEQQRDLLNSLHAAVEVLTLCLERIESLIGQVNQTARSTEGPTRHQPSRISFGGGPSALAGVTPRGEARFTGIPSDSMPGSREVPLSRREDGLDRRQAAQRGPGTAELMAVSEMVHLGYSREEIGERLRARWGEKATAILREALD